jgi:hypothetical protein
MAESLMSGMLATFEGCFSAVATCALMAAICVSAGNGAHERDNERVKRAHLGSERLVECSATAKLNASAVVKTMP